LSGTCLRRSTFSRVTSRRRSSFLCVLTAEASFAARLEPDSAANPNASKPAVLSLIPNVRALELIVSVAGFRELQLLEPAPHHNPQYRERDRVVAIARVDWSRTAREATP